MKTVKGMETHLVLRCSLCLSQYGIADYANRQLGSQIYLYVAGKTYRRWRKSEIPDDIRVASLTDKPMRDLTLLKDWIYR